MRAATKRSPFVPFLDLAVDECFRSTKMLFVASFQINLHPGLRQRGTVLFRLLPRGFTTGYSQACHKRRGTRAVGWKLVAGSRKPVLGLLPIANCQSPIAHCPH